MFFTFEVGTAALRLVTLWRKFVATNPDTRNIISIFISYSWDDGDHVIWVSQPCRRGFERDGIDAIIDQTHLALGARTTEFTERSVRDSRYVLVVCFNYDN